MDSILKTLLDNWIAALVLFGCVTGLLTSIATELRKYGSHRHELDLKRELVERGLSVEEIERIIAARPPRDAKNKGKQKRVERHIAIIMLLRAIISGKEVRAKNSFGRDFPARRGLQWFIFVEARHNRKIVERDCPKAK